MSIIECDENLEESARKRREKLKRQDTPLHPKTTPSGVMKRRSIPKSLSINVNPNSPHSSPCIRSISYDGRERFTNPGQTTKHNKSRNLTSSPKHSTNIPKVEKAPR